MVEYDGDVELLLQSLKSGQWPRLMTPMSVLVRNRLPERGRRSFRLFDQLLKRLDLNAISTIAFDPPSLSDQHRNRRVDDSGKEGVDGASGGVETVELREDSECELLLQILRLTSSEFGPTDQLASLYPNESSGVVRKNVVRLCRHGNLLRAEAAARQLHQSYRNLCCVNRRNATGSLLTAGLWASKPSEVSCRVALKPIARQRATVEMYESPFISWVFQLLNFFLACRGGATRHHERQSSNPH